MCMGTTSWQARPEGAIPVHPHVHGDNDVLDCCQGGGVRFTPMCMGTTASFFAGLGRRNGSPPCAWGQRRWMTCGRRRYPVHPHVHGDNLLASKARGGDPGSPPCAWGQRCARLLPGWRCPVHPHVHGDNCFFLCRPWPPERFTPMCMGTTFDVTDLPTTVAGSPPCAWGQRSRLVSSRLSLRFTPMCMGTTSFSSSSA